MALNTLNKLLMQPAISESFCHFFVEPTLADGKILIHKPGLPGNEDFKTKAAAEKVATLIITKIKKRRNAAQCNHRTTEKLNVL
jgi:hypothetical protein